MNDQPSEDNSDQTGQWSEQHGHDPFYKSSQETQEAKEAAGQSNLALPGRLDSRLNQAEPYVVQFSVNDLNAVGNTVIYKELREAYLSGEVTQSQFGDGQKKYSQMVTRTLKSQWEQTAALDTQEVKDQYPYCEGIRQGKMVRKRRRKECVTWNRFLFLTVSGF